MDFREELFSKNWTKTLLSENDSPQNASLNNQSPNEAGSKKNDQNWENPDPSLLDFSSRIDLLLSKFSQVSGNPSTLPCDQSRISSSECIPKNPLFQSWDPRDTLNNLSFLEQRIHQLQELVHIIVGSRSLVSGCIDELVTHQQQLITTDLTSIIVQLISTAGSLIPSMKDSLAPANPSTGQLGQFGVPFPSTICPTTGLFPPNNEGQIQQKFSETDQSHYVDQSRNCQMDHNSYKDYQEPKDEDDPIEEEHLPPGSFEILQPLKEEILAPHTHFCKICGKGFKRDANLRMHMRGHGDEYKTLAALAKPHKESNGSESVLLKRYSCPVTGCKRNQEHKKFLPLKTVLCVKNHYMRTHCDKTYTCSRCHTKKFSIISDLKTHEKHCGKDKWLCSCGTTFSRKDKLFGHIALFQGHTPAIPFEENHKRLIGSSSNIKENSETSSNKVGSADFSFGSDCRNGIQSTFSVTGTGDDNCFSIIGFDPCNLGGFQEFSQSGFSDSGSSFSFLITGNRNGLQPESNDMD